MVCPLFSAAKVLIKTDMGKFLPPVWGVILCEKGQMPLRIDIKALTKGVLFCGKRWHIVRQNMPFCVAKAGIWQNKSAFMLFIAVLFLAGIRILHYLCIYQTE